MPPNNLDAWIPKNKHTIYFIGLQESTYQQPKEFKNCEEHLYSIFKNHMGPNYILLEVPSLSSLFEALELCSLLVVHAPRL